MRQLADKLHRLDRIQFRQFVADLHDALRESMEGDPTHAVPAARSWLPNPCEEATTELAAGDGATEPSDPLGRVVVMGMPSGMPPGPELQHLGGMTAVDGAAGETASERIEGGLVGGAGEGVAQIHIDAGAVEALQLSSSASTVISAAAMPPPEVPQAAAASPNIIDDLDELSPALDDEVARRRLNQILEGYSQIEWWGTFRDLRSGTHEYARKVRNDFRESNEETNEGEGIAGTAASIRGDEVDDFKGFLSTYGA